MFIEVRFIFVVTPNCEEARSYPNHELYKWQWANSVNAQKRDNDVLQTLSFNLP